MRRLFLAVLPLSLSFTPPTARQSRGPHSAVRRFNTQNEDEGDFITRIFKRFLPDPEEMGMSRMTIDSAPEQYYCTKDRWALPVEDDDEIVRLFRPALAQTRFEKRSLKLCYDAERDGWNADTFHEKVDKQGPCVVFCRTDSGGVFGGYNPKGWVSYGEFRGSLAAFLFVWPDGDVAKNPLKLSKVGGAGLAQVDDGSGPKFGMTDLAIPLGFKTLPGTVSGKRVYSKLGSYYERMPGGENSLLPGFKGEDMLSELKVYQGVYGPDEYIPFTDAEPFALN
jgi:hypothetical protein